MTELADEISVRITLYPDRAEHRYNTNIDKLRDWCRSYLGPIGPIVVSGNGGKLVLFGGGVELEFKHTGLMELPEEGGGGQLNHGKAPKRILGKLQEVKVEFGPFPGYCWVVVGPREDMHRYIAWRRGPQLDRLPQLSARGACWPWISLAKPIIWLTTAKGPKGIAALAHESVHCAHQVTLYMGIALSDETQEVFCYLVDHIVGTVLEELRA